MGFLSMILLFFTLDSIQLTQKRKKLNLFVFGEGLKDFSLETTKQLLKKSLEVFLSFKDWKYIDQFFLIPLTMWTTIETAFLTAQFTRVRISFLNLNIRLSYLSSGFYYMSYWYSVKHLFFFFS
jgi:hypothetical protein